MVTSVLTLHVFSGVNLYDELDGEAVIQHVVLDQVSAVRVLAFCLHDFFVLLQVMEVIDTPSCLVCVETEQCVFVINAHQLSLGFTANSFVKGTTLFYRIGLYLVCCFVEDLHILFFWSIFFLLLFSSSKIHTLVLFFIFFHYFDFIASMHDVPVNLSVEARKKFMGFRCVFSHMPWIIARHLPY